MAPLLDVPSPTPSTSMQPPPSTTTATTISNKRPRTSIPATSSALSSSTTAHQQPSRAKRRKPEGSVGPDSSGADKGGRPSFGVGMVKGREEEWGEPADVKTKINFLDLPVETLYRYLEYHDLLPRWDVSPWSEEACTPPNALYSTLPLTATTQPSAQPSVEPGLGLGPDPTSSQPVSNPLPDQIASITPLGSTSESNGMDQSGILNEQSTIAPGMTDLTTTANVNSEGENAKPPSIETSTSNPNRNPSPDPSLNPNPNPNSQNVQTTSALEKSTTSEHHPVEDPTTTSTVTIPEDIPAPPTTRSRTLPSRKVPTPPQASPPPREIKRGVMTLSDVYAARAVLAEKANSHWIKGLGGGQNQESSTIVAFLYKNKVGHGRLLRVYNPYPISGS